MLGISPEAPIARFGRWLETLSLKDVFVIGVLSPVLGLASVAGPVVLINGWPRDSQALLEYSAANMAFGRTILCLFGVGVLVALLSRKLGVWAATTVMAVYFLGIVYDSVSQAPGHNLLPFELAAYGLLTAFAVAGAAVVALVRG